MLTRNDYYYSSPFYICGAFRASRRFGRRKGIRIAEVLGLISVWGFFSFWFGIWVSPQPRFSNPIFNDTSIQIINFSIPLLQLIISTFLIIPGTWFGIKGVKDTTLKVAETHRTERIVTIQ